MTSKRVYFRISAALAFAAGTMFAQAPAKPPADPVFEVATIKPSPPLDPQKMVAGKMNIGMKVDGAMVNIGFFPLSDLIAQAYRVKSFQVSGPDWIKTQRFD